MEKVKETAKKLFTGETTVNKRDLWFVGAICLLAGIICGLKKAPWTHGVMIGSNNGNYNGDGCDCCGCDCDCDCDCDCEECCECEE